ncbi:MAG: alpha/beta fold hydrolase [Caulobacter sp.]|nr:alpha/beta fold hydrolase [Caulobacter sp.]
MESRSWPVTLRIRQVNGLDMHLADAGPADGPLVILLHGFPEFWFEWRALIPVLADAGYRVIAPDQRGYNLSDKPKGARNYVLDLLAADVLALANLAGKTRFSVIGHDWGAAVAWWLATRHAGRIDRLVVMNAPHPAIWRRGMDEDPEQRRKSRYVRLFRLPLLPELILGVGRRRALAAAFDSAKRPEAYAPSILERYREAWSQPGALTGMINWYRALFLQDLPIPAPGSLTPPTLIVWGEQDDFAGVELARSSLELCADGRFCLLPEAGHWSPHDAPEQVAAAVLDFLGGVPTR